MTGSQFLAVDLGLEKATRKKSLEVLEMYKNHIISSKISQTRYGDKNGRSSGQWGRSLNDSSASPLRGHRSSQQQTDPALQSRQQVIKMLVVIITVFLISLGPILIIHVINNISGYKNVGGYNYCIPGYTNVGGYNYRIPDQLGTYINYTCYYINISVYKNVGGYNYFIPDQFGTYINCTCYYINISGYKNVGGYNYCFPDQLGTEVVFNLLPYVQSSLNPVIYIIMSKNIRRSICKHLPIPLIKLCSRCGDQNYNTMVSMNSTIPAHHAIRSNMDHQRSVQQSQAANL
ncbi:hypothetical protein LOTGIDRAFT_157456 [Lottia gigantea]|uniref:G-protein coupled receptors family 1 profile domain-containing protein n=1 Tax=Lottia gigantea TaxID=225164 RepID=V4CGQ5_LOTGI|nr:hypothetical protein LOTGIDRAFT_157456 [Lottia gigantea]ESP01280.1 hypothetical protein LOTGIDRAFT_157456 [Lottia gigantea]